MASAASAILHLCILALLSRSTFAGGASTSSRGKWQVKDTNGSVCIIFWAEISFQLDYYKIEPDEALASVKVSVPAASTTEGSSCMEAVSIGGDTTIDAQVLQLNFPKNPGWSVRLAFTRDSRFELDKDEFALFQVNVTANYSSMLDVFDIDKTSLRNHTYYQPVDLSNPPDIADSLYTSLDHSYFCPSKEAFVINSDEHLGPAALIYLETLQMQAFRTAKNTDWGTRDTCPADQRSIDKLPIIVACSLAGLVIITLAIYLIYRWRLPPEIINLTVPEGDENKAFEDGEEDDHHGGGHGGHGHHRF